MTEEEWLACTNYGNALQLLCANRSTRKWRCFALACIRLIWHVLTPPLRGIVEVSERFLDGEATNRERSEARRQIPVKQGIVQSQKGTDLAVTEAVYWATAAPTDIVVCASSVPGHIRQVVGRDGGPTTLPALDGIFIDLLREIFGNPFRPIPRDAVPRTREVKGLAQAAYEERNLPSAQLDAVRLAVLADALEDAGCTEAAILDHLRDPGPHVRGCWALGLLLGKE